MNLAKRLNEELAQQARRDRKAERAKSPDLDQRAKSYDHRTSTSKGKGTYFAFYFYFERILLFLLEKRLKFNKSN